MVEQKVNAKKQNEKKTGKEPEKAEGGSEPLCPDLEQRSAALETAAPEERLGALLSKYALSISTAESCTGGLVAAKLVNVAGSSAYFKEGFITYSNKAKRRTLGVSKTTIRREGAVSEQTAKEMAIGAAMAADSDLAVSVTGNAGPTAEENKPVGLVYIGIYFNGRVKVLAYGFQGSRNEIREQAACNALNLCIQTIEKAAEKKQGKA